MVRKLTREYKERACAHCQHCDKRALRKGWQHCKPGYKNHNGHCENLKATKPSKRTTDLLHLIDPNIDRFFSDGTEGGDV